MCRVLEKSSAILLRTECRQWIAIIAGPREWNGNRESWLALAADRSKLSPRMIKSLFYGEIIDRDHAAVAKLKNAAAEYETKNIADSFELLAAKVRRLDRDGGQQACLPLDRIGR